MKDNENKKWNDEKKSWSQQILYDSSDSIANSVHLHEARFIICWKWAMMIEEFLKLARANIAIQSCLNYTELICRWKNRCLILSAWQHYEKFYIQYIMRILLKNLIDSENYYHESQNSLYSWFVDLNEDCAKCSALNMRSHLLDQYSCSPSFTRLDLLVNHQIQHIFCHC